MFLFIKFRVDGGAEGFLLICMWTCGSVCKCGVDFGDKWSTAIMWAACADVVRVKDTIKWS